MGREVGSKMFHFGREGAGALDGLLEAVLRCIDFLEKGSLVITEQIAFDIAPGGSSSTGDLTTPVI